MKEDTLVVHEIYASIQGESTFAGLPCAFVRLTGCNLRCVWCDTPQAFYGGTRMRRDEVLARALALGTPLVELTGGEPLLQPGVIPLLRELCDAGKQVLIETSGEAPIGAVDPRAAEADVVLLGVLLEEADLRPVGLRRRDRSGGAVR